MSRSKRISRRTVLRGMGGMIALPWLDAMSPARASVGRYASTSFSHAASAPPVRMAFLYVPNGMHMPDWTPTSEGRDFAIPKTLEPIAAYRDEFSLLSGLTLNGARALGDGGGDHARSVASFLTGAHPKKTDGTDIQNGPSVDQITAEQVGDQTRLASLELGMEPSAPAGRCDSGYSCVYTSNMSWRTESSPVAKEVNPRDVFDRLFGDPNLVQNKVERSRRERYRKSILDFVQEDADALRRQLGINDQRKLEEYLYAVRAIERQIDSAERLRGPEDSAPDYPRPEGVPAEFDEHLKMMLDLMALAFQTDATRISTFMFANAGSNRSYRQVNVSEGHHDLSHHGNNEGKQKKIAQINLYHVTLFRHLLARLHDTQEGDGSLLDNCMVVYGSGIGDGNRHNHDNLPILLAGRGGGTLSPGRHIQYRRETPLTNLYLAMMQRMGADVGSFSDSTGILDQLDG